MKIATLIVLVLMIMLPTVPLLPSPPPGNPAVDSARQALQGARRDLVERAGGGWGGHMEIAVKHIDEALSELQEAEKWAREHHENK
jgi:hypothetical protein